MEKRKSYRKINAIKSVKECNMLLVVGRSALDTIGPQFKADLQSRLAALEARKQRLLAADAIRKTQRAR